MPFRIVRNDITRVSADAIVNTANPEATYGAGTDSAIYRAAGESRLLAARKRIGTIEPGEAAVTSAFRLPAKFVIHTVGPAWIDGTHGEYEILRSCYRKSLELAEELGCKSVAFPLISAGSYGFPKDQALEIALSSIRGFLDFSELDVILVVFGSDSFQLASGLTERIEEYIDDHYVDERKEIEYGSAEGALEEANRRRNFWVREHQLKNRKENRPAGHGAPMPPEELKREEEGSYILQSPRRPSAAGSAPASRPPADGSPSADRPPLESSTPAYRPVSGKKSGLDRVLDNLGESFQKRLLRMIDERGMSDPEVYKRANLDRKLFSKIRCHEDYIPKKKTIIALAIALRLNMDDTKDLLASAGLLLANNNKADVIVAFCIENGIYDIFEVNALLFRFDQPILG